MSVLKVGQLRRWTIPVHPMFGKHDADGMVFRVASINEPQELEARGEYVNGRAGRAGRARYCHTTPEWMAANSVIVEDAP